MIEFPISKNVDSSLISKIDYFEESKILCVNFKDYFRDKIYFGKVSKIIYEEFCNSKSKGKFYLEFIKIFFKPQKSITMAAADLIIKCKINVTKIPKEWLYTGESGVYANFTLLYKEEKDQYGNNGVIVMNVPSEIYKEEKSKEVPKDKMTRGVILGNGKVFENSLRSEILLKEGDMTMDDLPF